MRVWLTNAGRAGVLECGDEEIHTTFADTDSLEELVRVAGEPMGFRNPVEKEDSRAVFVEMTGRSPLTFKHRMLELPLGTKYHII